MKMVILDGSPENPGDLSWDELGKLGELTVYDWSTPEEAIERVKDADAIFANKVSVNREVINSAKNLKYIGLQSTGYNVVDFDATNERGIVVTNIPAYGTEAVAQSAIALLLEITNRVGYHARLITQGEWSKRDEWCFWDHPLIELSGKTIGIIGMGAIGQATARIAKAFGMNVIGTSRSPKPELEKEGFSIVTLDELLKNSDVISLHCPLFESTEGMINKESIKKMKEGVIIINNARGALIVDEDLYDGLVSGKIAGAGLDVLSEEPAPKNHILLKAPNCYITPHIAWAPKETRARLMNFLVSNYESFLSGNTVNQVGKK